MIFDEKTFCGKVFNDAINLSLDLFEKKYEAKSESVKKSPLSPEEIKFILDDSTALQIRSYGSSNKVTSCQCQFEEPSKIEQFLQTVKKNNLFEYDIVMGTLYFYPNNIAGLSMKQISIYAEKTMFYYFVELILIY